MKRHKVEFIKNDEKTGQILLDSMEEAVSYARWVNEIGTSITAWYVGEVEVDEDPEEFLKKIREQWEQKNPPSIKKYDIPVIPPREPPCPPYDPNPVVGRCGVCGVIIRQIMYMTCSNARCPVFPRIWM